MVRILDCQNRVQGKKILYGSRKKVFSLTLMECQPSLPELYVSQMKVLVRGTLFSYFILYVQTSCLLHSFSISTCLSSYLLFSFLASSQFKSYNDLINIGREREE